MPAVLTEWGDSGGWVTGGRSCQALRHNLTSLYYSLRFAQANTRLPKDVKLHLPPRSWLLGEVKVLGWKRTISAECQKTREGNKPCCQAQKGRDENQPHFPSVSGAEALPAGPENSFSNVTGRQPGQGSHLWEDTPHQHPCLHKLLLHGLSNCAA